MNVTSTPKTAATSQVLPSAKSVLQRQCVCGNHTNAGGECSSCASKKLQKKLSIGAANDPLELEADRVAEQVLADKPAHSFSNISAPKIQRRAEQSSEHSEEVPASVERVLAGSGSPMPQTVRKDMEQRFGQDFSQVRMHTGFAAEQSANDVNANAYAVGNNIVFNRGKFSPETNSGKRLLAHELTHVVQQSSQLHRDVIDPVEQMAGITNASVHSIVIDPGSGRVKFYTRGGTALNGQLVEKISSFSEGEYLLRKSEKKDPLRTWEVFTPDGKKYGSGLQFRVVLDEVKDFSSIGYTADVTLRVQSGVLPKLINIPERINAIRKEVSKSLVNDDEELALIKLLSDIPAEQAEEFVKQLRAEKIGEVSLIDQLDKDVDGDNNIALHQALSKLKLQAGGVKTAAALVDAPTLAWHDVMGFFEQKAVFSVTRTTNGKIRIRYLGGIASGLFSNPDYSEVKNMSRKDRLNIMTGYGIEVDAAQPIIVHDYDNDRQIVLTAEDLIAYQHAGVRKFMQDMGTIASLATPAGAETVGGRVLAYGVQIASVATLIVDENKLNIRKWFPHWGPAIIAASEKIKLALAVIGIAQLVQGGWKLFTRLRQIRSARAAMDVKAVVAGAEEAALAENQAARLESRADGLLNQAEQARKELGLADEVAEVAAAEKNAANTAASTTDVAKLGASAGDKTRIIDNAIGAKNYGGEFGALVNRELAANPHKMRASKIPGYSVEIPIEGTEHFLARKPNGTWCLFSSDPKGCGVISIASTVDKAFGDAAREVEQAKALPKKRVPFADDPDFAESIRDAENVPGVNAPRSDKSTSDLGNLPSKRGSPYVKGLHSADMGVAEGKAAASRDGLTHVFDNPKGMEHSVTGLDSIYRDKAGNLFIVEFKGGDAKLSAKQMSAEWVTKKIVDLEKNPQLKDLPLVKELRAALDGKKLQGRTYFTPLEQTTGRVLDTAKQNHGIY